MLRFDVSGDSENLWHVSRDEWYETFDARGQSCGRIPGSRPGPGALRGALPFQGQRRVERQDGECEPDPPARGAASVPGRV